MTATPPEDLLETLCREATRASIAVDMFTHSGSTSTFMHDQFLTDMGRWQGLLSAIAAFHGWPADASSQGKAAEVVRAWRMQHDLLDADPTKAWKRFVTHHLAGLTPAEQDSEKAS